MTKSTYITNVRAISALDDILGAIGNSAKIEIWDDTGTTPADADATEGSNVLLATVTGHASSGCFAGASDGTGLATAALNATSADGTVVGGGPHTADFMRIATSGDVVVMQGTVGVGSAFNLDMNTVTWATSDTVSITSGTCTLSENSAA